MPNIIFTPDIVKQYTVLQQKDKMFCKKFNSLLNDIARHSKEGIGRPERLKGYDTEVYSRRIDDKNRVVYSIAQDATDSVTLLQITGHYKDK